MTSLSQFQSSDCEPSSAERIGGALMVTLFAVVVLVNTTAVVLTLLAA
jgi:uncharacterized integral membrane protein